MNKVPIIISERREELVFNCIIYAMFLINSKLRF